MGKRLHVVKRQREYGRTEAFNWCFDKFRDLMDDLGCNVCADDEFSDFWEMTKNDYMRAIAIIKIIKDKNVPVDGDYKDQQEKIDQIYNSEEYQELFDNEDCQIGYDDIDLNDVIGSIKNLDIDLDELIIIMVSFMDEADKKSDWIQFEAW